MRKALHYALTFASFLAFQLTTASSSWACSAGFTYSINGIQVTFIDTSQNANQWFWAFGDGQTSSVQHPVHGYGYDGLFKVMLIASDTLTACNDTIYKNILLSLPPSGTVFHKIYSNADNQNLQSMIVNTDGNIVLHGGSDNMSYSNHSDFWMIVDTLGDTIHTQSLSAQYSGFLKYSLVQSPDGNYIMGGNQEGSHSDTKHQLVKMDANGNNVWHKTFGPYGYYDPTNNEDIYTSDFFGSVASFKNGISAISGSIIDKWETYPPWQVYWPGFLVQKINTNGGISAGRTYKSLGCFSSKVMHAADGGFLFIMYDGPLYVCKLNSNMEMVWRHGIGSNKSFGDAVLAADGGFYIALTVNYNVSNDFLGIIKLDAGGYLEWHHFYSNNGSSIYPNSLVLQDDKLIVTGIIPSTNSNDIFLASFDTLGNFEYAKTYGGSGEERYPVVVATPDNGYAIGASTNSFGSNYDLYLIKTDHLGNTGCEQALMFSTYDYTLSSSPLYGSFSSQIFGGGESSTFSSGNFTPSGSEVCSQPLLCETNYNYAKQGKKLHITSLYNPNLVYQWDFGDGSPIVTLPYPTHTFDTTGLFTISLITTDSAGTCSDTLEKLVTITCPLAITTDADNTRCGYSTGSVAAMSIDGFPPYTYEWFDTAGTIGATSTIDSLPAGIYHVTVTDTTTCSVSDTVTVEEFVTTQINIQSYYTTCYPDLMATAVAMVDSAVPPLDYLWSGGQTTDSVTGLPPGGYTLTVTDSNACAKTDSFTIAPNPYQALSSSHTQQNVVCFGDSNGYLAVTVTGGDPPLSYAWSNGATADSIHGLAAGTFVLTTTDTLGCTLTDSFNITQPSSLLANIAATSNNCFGDSTGAIHMTVSGGTMPYSYQWNNGDTTPDLLNIPAGQYIVLFRDSNGCVDSAGIVVSEPSALSAFITTNAVTCYGGQDGTADLTVSGGTPGYVFFWSNGATTEDLSGLVAGAYSVAVTDSNGCFTADSAAVIEPAPILLDITATDVTCYGDSDGIIDMSVQNGVAPFSYNWSNGATTEDLKNLPEGTYTVQVTDSNGCTADSSAQVNMPDSLSITFVIGKPARVDAVVTGGTPPYQYLWSNGVTTATIVGFEPGNYTLQVTDHNGCQQQDSVSVVYPSTGAQTASEQGGIHCFPNPTTGEVQVQLAFATPQDTRILLYSSQGKLLLEFMPGIVDHWQQMLDLSQHPSGIYLLQVQAGNERYAEKLVLVR